MKFRKLLLTILSILSVGLLSACSSTDVEGNAHAGTNILGIYKYEPNNYGPVPAATAHVTTDDLTVMELPGGGKTTWLWGFITYTDY
ncbi:MAG: hypothetical protein R3Y46_04050 [Opitutales bacterium]